MKTMAGTRAVDGSPGLVSAYRTATLRYVSLKFHTRIVVYRSGPPKNVVLGAFPANSCSDHLASERSAHRPHKGGCSEDRTSQRGRRTANTWSASADRRPRPS